MTEVSSLAQHILWESLWIPSKTGMEKEMALFCAELLQQRNFKVNVVDHSENRASISAFFGNPTVAFCTHLDTAIDWREPRIEGERIYGIGACDAKGSLACQASVAINLAKNDKPIALLFLAGEENDSVGAKYIAENPLSNIKYIIHGEPTGGAFVTKTASVVELEIIVKGQHGHSSCDNNEISSIHRLISIINNLKKQCVNNALTFHVGCIRGGDSPSSFPLNAVAMVQIRGYLKTSEIIAITKKLCTDSVEINEMFRNECCNYITLPDYPRYNAFFGSDAAFLQAQYSQLLVGPGEIVRGHKIDEFIFKNEIEQGVEALFNAYDFLQIRKDGAL